MESSSESLNNEDLHCENLPAKYAPLRDYFYTSLHFTLLLAKKDFQDMALIAIRFTATYRFSRNCLNSSKFLESGSFFFCPKVKACRRSGTGMSMPRIGSTRSLNLAG